MHHVNHENPPIEELLDQLFSLEGLDRLPRTGFLQRGVSDPESVAEHSWHVATLVWSLLPFVQPIDGLRALELALLHDVGEALLGDLPSPAKTLFPPGAKAEAEEKAFRQVLRGSNQRAETLAAELRDGSSLEARLVHHCDRLQLLIKTALYARWNEGASMEFFQDQATGQSRANARSSHGCPSDHPLEAQFSVVEELRRALIRRVSEETDGATL